MELPADLPVPVDDGAAAHLRGMQMPHVVLPSTAGHDVDVAGLGAGRTVLYVYPRTGRPDRPVPAGWDEIPGARGCTPQSCAFRDHVAELAELGAGIAGLSTQTLDEQLEFADRNEILYPVIADPEGR